MSNLTEDNAFAVGFGELDGNSLASEGDCVQCQICGGAHPLKGGTNTKTGEHDTTLLCYKCGDELYLAAVGGRLLNDVSLVQEATDADR
jgi:hypothetical protein